jgi:hypothetical protein
MAFKRRVGRRKLLRLAALSPLGVIAACGASGKMKPSQPVAEPEALVEEVTPPAPNATPGPVTTTPQPFVIAQGEQRRLMMEGTPQETPLYVYGSGRPGKTVMVLGGVHGNEPGGWLAAERVQQTFRPATGAFLIIPRANRVATNAFERTLPSLGDLNRLYPGSHDASQPMARMAAQIIDTLREFRVDVLLDMHESWAFYKDRTQNGTAYLGQTIATAPVEPGITLVHDIVVAVNSRVRASQEEFFDRLFPGPQQSGQNLPRSTPTPGPPPTGTSSLSLNKDVPGLTPILVEMGQQQALERRIALHVDVFEELARRLGISGT